MALKRHSRRPAGRQPGYALVVLSAFLFAAGGNAVKALFKLGYSPLVLAQLRIWWAFAWLLLILLTVRPALLRVKRRELPALAIFGTIGLAGVQLSYYLTIARINIAVALLVQYLGLVAVTAFERYHRRQAVPAQVWVALAMVLVGAFFAVGAYQPELLRVNLPGVMLGLVAAGVFAFYILRASTLASTPGPPARSLAPAAVRLRRRQPAVGGVRRRERTPPPDRLADLGRHG